MTINKAEIVAKLIEFKVPFSEIESMKTLFDQEQIQQMGLVSDTGKCKYVRFPV